jgi:hypothetical protein
VNVEAIFHPKRHRDSKRCEYCQKARGHRSLCPAYILDTVLDKDLRESIMEGKGRKEAIQWLVDNGVARIYKAGR